MHIIAEKMGISTIDELIDLGLEKINEVDRMYDDLKSNGVLETQRAESPYIHIRNYMEHYVKAIERRFIEDTTLKPEYLDKVYREQDVKPAEEILSKDDFKKSISKESLEENSYLQIEEIIESAITKHLGISKGHAQEIKKSQPQEYYKIAEKLIKEDAIPLQTTHRYPFFYHDTLMAEKLGVPVSEVEKMDITKREIIHTIMNGKGIFDVKLDNPYLKNRLIGFVSDILESYGNSKSENQFNRLQKLFNSNQNQTPQVDLSSGDRALMTIRGISTSDYFARYAAPAIITQLETERIQTHKPIQLETPEMQTACTLG